MTKTDSALVAETARAYGTLHIPVAEYASAEAADQAFDAALLAQFGKGARWRVSPKDFNAATLRAYEAKQAADLALHKAFLKLAQNPGLTRGPRK